MVGRIAWLLVALASAAFGLGGQTGPVLEGSLSPPQPIARGAVVDAWIASDGGALSKTLAGFTGSLRRPGSVGSIPAKAAAGAFDFRGGRTAALVVRLPAGAGRGATAGDDPATPGGLLVLLDRLDPRAPEAPVVAFRIFEVPSRVGPVPVRIATRLGEGRPLTARRMVVSPRGSRKAPEGKASGPVEFRILDQGTYSSVYKAGDELLTDGQALAGVWSRIHQTRTRPPPVPAVDFAKESVVAVFMGQKTTGGHAVEVAGVTVDGATATVVVVETRPAAGGFVTMALTAPYVLVAIPRGPGAVTITRRGRAP